MSNDGAKTEFEAQAESLIAAGLAGAEFLANSQEATDRERLAMRLARAMDDAGGGYVNIDNGADAVIIDGWFDLNLVINALIADGFGDIAQAKSEALEEAFDAKELGGVRPVFGWDQACWLRTRAAEYRA